MTRPLKIGAAALVLFGAIIVWVRWPTGPLRHIQKTTGRVFPAGVADPLVAFDSGDTP